MSGIRTARDAADRALGVASGQDNTPALSRSKVAHLADVPVSSLFDLPRRPGAAPDMAVSTADGCGPLTVTFHGGRSLTAARRWGWWPPA